MRSFLKICSLFIGGDSCQNGEHSRSTRITLSCDKYEHEPVFIEETATCEYVFSWATPFACPKHVVQSSTCVVKDPLYGFSYDLSPLRNMVKDYSTNDGTDDFFVNVCGPVVGEYAGTLPSNTSVVITDKDKIISAGTYPAKLIFNDGTLSMEFSNGSPCGENKTHTSQIIFLCDHEHEDTTSGLSVFRDHNACLSSFVWRTKMVCPPHTVIDCSVTTKDNYRYDLNPLSLPNMNQEEFSKSNEKKYVLNVCRSVVHSKAARCAYDAAACLIDESNKNQSVNMGIVGQGPFIDNGRLKVLYENGDKCNATHRYSTEIYFECDKFNLYPYPNFIAEENCKFIFEWKTKQACPEKIEVSSFGVCTGKDIYTNYMYDLSMLNKKVYEVKKDDVSLLLNVCGAVADQRCPDSTSGSCSKSSDNKSYISAGQANANLMVIPGTLTLRYTDGSPCKNGVKATTLISFFCGAEYASEGPVLVSIDYESCTYFVNWHTELACQYRVSCFAQGYDRDIDMRPLIKHSSNYQVQGPNKTDTFYLNMCRPLNHVMESTCTAGSSACMVSHLPNGTVVSTTLGKPLMRPTTGYHDSDVMIMYPLGSTCRKNPGLKYSVRINFICNATAGVVSFIFILPMSLMC